MKEKKKTKRGKRQREKEENGQRGRLGKTSGRKRARSRGQIGLDTGNIEKQ